MADIFISYAREDSATAERLAHALEEHGWSVFWDRRIPAGRNFDTFILEQIRAAACMVVLWSRAACESEWVFEEAKEGRQRGILVPARIDNVDPPFGFSRIQCADLIAWRSTKSGDLTALINDVLVLVGQATKPSSDASTVPPRNFKFWTGKERKTKLGDVASNLFVASDLRKPLITLLSLVCAASTLVSVYGTVLMAAGKFTADDYMPFAFLLAYLLLPV